MARAIRRRLAWFAVVIVGAAAVVVWWLDRPAAPSEDAVERAGAGTGASEPVKPRIARQRDTTKTESAEADPPVPAEAKAAEAEKKAAEETFPFTVTVLRGDGTPAAGANVRLVDPTADEEGDTVVGHATADANGVASMRSVDAEVRIVAWLGSEATATGELIAVKERHEITVRLGPSMVVRGRVLRGDAAPEPGAAVELDVSPWKKSDFGLALRTTSGADGRFEFPPIAKDGIDPLNPPGVEATANDMARGFAGTDLDRPDAELVVHLVPGFSARGRFVDAAGKPVAAELIAVGARRYSATADADGRVTLRLPEAGYRFVARRTTSQSVISSRETGDPIVTQWRVGRTVGVRANDATGDDDLGDVVFAAGKPVTGIVVDATGAPQRQAQITLFLADFEIASVVTGDDGRFVLPEVSDEPHHLYAYASGSDHPDDEARRATADNVRGGDPELRVVVGESLAIAFRFLADGDCTPVAVADIRVRAKPHGTSEGTATQSIGDPTATFAIAVPSPGSYDVDVEVGGYESHHLESVEVVAGRRTSLDLLLRKKHE